VWVHKSLSCIAIYEFGNSTADLCSLHPTIRVVAWHLTNDLVVQLHNCLVTASDEPLLDFVKGGVIGVAQTVRDHPSDLFATVGQYEVTNSVGEMRTLQNNLYTVAYINNHFNGRET
jgi:hypothetical protein